MMADFQKAAELALECGFFKAGVVPVSEIIFDRAFRKACEQNTCGNYGKCWTCPPDAGDIDELIAKAKAFDYAVVYQSVSPLEDSFDIEGMTAAAVRHNEMTGRFVDRSAALWKGDFLHLSASGAPNGMISPAVIRTGRCLLWRPMVWQSHSWRSWQG